MIQTNLFFKKEGRKATNSLSNKLGVIFSLTFLFLFSISLISAQPSTTIYAFPQGYTIAPAQFETLKAGEDIVFNFFLVNSSDGKKITNVTANCSFNLADSQGNVILEGTQEYSPKGYWYTIINGSYVENTGYYYYGIDCTDGLAGILTEVLEVTNTGISNERQVYGYLVGGLCILAIFLVSFALYKPKSYGYNLFGGMMFILAGILLWLIVLSGIEDLFLRMGSTWLLIGLGTFFIFKEITKLEDLVPKSEEEEE